MSTTVQIKDYDGVQRSYAVNKGIRLANADGTGFETFTQDGGSNAALLGVLDGTITQLTAQDLAGLTELRDWAMQNQMNLASLEIPEGVTVIGYNCCEGCDALTTVSFPSTLQYIGDMAFYATPITSAVFGANILSIGNGAFFGCADLATVEVNAATPPQIGIEVFDGCTSLAAIYVPAGAVSAYKAAPNWSDYASIIQAKP